MWLSLKLLISSSAESDQV